MSVSLELAEKMLTKFDGNKTKLYEFIDNCDKSYNLVKTEHQATLFAIIETKLTDNARAMVRNRSFENWKSLKQHLLDIYSERRTMGQWQLELNSCKQNPSESVMAYSNKVENCYIKLINSLDDSLTKEARSACLDLLKNQALNVFISGLNKDLSLIIKASRPESLENAIALALNEEQELKSKLEISKYTNVNNNFVKHCNLCNKSGHTSYNCHSNKNRNIRQIQSNHSQKFCNYCKKQGHVINECRKREYNNKKRENSSTTSNYQPNHLNYKASQPPAAGLRTAKIIRSNTH